MGRTRRKSLSADFATVFLAHAFDPSTDVYAEDFRHADRDVWRAPYGGYSTTTIGNPDPIDTIGNFDAKSRDFDGVGDEYQVAVGDALDVPSDGSFTDLTLCKAPNTNEGNRALFSNWVDGQTGSRFHRITLDQQGGFRVFIENIQSKQSSDEALYDGEVHLLGQHFDRGAPDNNEAMMVDGFIPARQPAVTSQAFDDNDDVTLGSQGGLLNPWIGPIDMHFTAADWVSEPQFEFLYNALVTGDIAPGTLRRLRSFVYGSRETGYKRRLPSHLVDAFGEGGPDFWWTPRRHLWGGGNGVVQLSNFASSDFGVQREGTDMGTLQGQSQIGRPATHISLDGDDFYSLPDHAAYGPFTVGVVAKASSTTPSNQTIYSIQSGGSSEFRFRLRPDIGRMGVIIFNDSGSFQVADVGVDPNATYVSAVASIDPSGDIYLTARSATQTDTQTATHQSGTYNQTTAYLSSLDGSSGRVNGAMKDIVVDRSVALSQSAADILRDGLAETTKIL